MVPSPKTCNYCSTANPTQATFCFACGQRLNTSNTSPKSATGLLIGNTLLNHRYRVIKRVGKGGFGAVYKAADEKFNNRPVAIKEMSQSELSSQQEIDEAARAFEQEALLLASLINPNLPRIYDHFSDFGRWYLVMDFIPGETLEEYLGKAKGKKLEIEEVLEIGIQLCAVLHYLHARQPPIIFRDLKPENILRTPDEGQIYLIDFGIARHFTGTKDKDNLGTPGYAPPEQYAQYGGQTTPHSDIYSLGATLHQLLSGDDPRDHPAFQFAPLPFDTNPKHAPLETLIFQMLEREQDKRPKSANDIKDELKRIATLQKASSPAGQQATIFPKQAPPKPFNQPQPAPKPIPVPHPQPKPINSPIPPIKAPQPQPVQQNQNIHSPIWVPPPNPPNPPNFNNQQRKNIHLPNKKGRVPNQGVQQNPGNQAIKHIFQKPLSPIIAISLLILIFGVSIIHSLPGSPKNSTHSVKAVSQTATPTKVPPTPTPTPIATETLPTPTPFPTSNELYTLIDLNDACHWYFKGNDVRAVVSVWYYDQYSCVDSSGNELGSVPLDEYCQQKNLGHAFDNGMRWYCLQNG